MGYQEEYRRWLDMFANDPETVADLQSIAGNEKEIEDRETGSRMDEVIFEEFKGTGNMELVLDRRLAEKRTWPAIDIFKSGTRKEERLLTLYERNVIWKFRQDAQNETENGIMDKIIKRMKEYKTNAELLEFWSKAKDNGR